MKKRSPKKLKSILGLTLHDNRLEAVWLRRTNGSVEVRKAVAAPLVLDLMNNELELVGREIRNHLDSAGIRERHCVVGIPPGWMLTRHTTLPDLPEDELASCLQLEAERNFPANPDQLLMGVSRHRTPSASYATQIAIMRDQMARLETVLAAAQLKPVSASLALATLPDAIPQSGPGFLTLTIGETHLDLLLSAGGGIVALRTLTNAFDTEGGEKRVLSDVVARELRITLGQLPEDLRVTFAHLRVVGPSNLAHELARALQSRLMVLGLTVACVSDYSEATHGLKIPSDTAVTGALSLAAQYLGDGASVLEFLPPKPAWWQQIAIRYANKRLAYGVGVTGVAAGLVALLFAYQQVRLAKLQASWADLQPRVDAIELIQTQIRTFRPWHDSSFASLSILERVTEAFPEDGRVTAKTLEIRDQLAVSISGTAKDNSSLLQTLDLLRETPGIGDMMLDQIRGKAPMQFTFNFQWSGEPQP